ncbi:hypothetical protein EKO04_007775 [Ascochyta lentis]|uniref:DUF6594 domain-containing protein n=1 Tax=Ascochyta lentis TaxID=205686 RepID=A0A8H7IZW7_9PLEO|nr:hypothetical protein EKO04_007775 [Ascochyta lentis]
MPIFRWPRKLSLDVEKQAEHYEDVSMQPDSRSPTLHNEQPLHPILTREEAEKEISETTTARLKDYSLGYPLQAAYQSSESSWSIYRGFSYLHARVILNMQEEIRLLEAQLEKLDMIHDCDDETKKRLRSRRDDLEQGKVAGEEGDSKRATLIGKIRDKLVCYDELLIKTREMNTLQRPSRRDYRSFRTWFYNVKPLGWQKEEEFIKRREDLVSLRHGREWSGFDGFIETCIRKMHCNLMQKIFATKELRDKVEGTDGTVFYYSPSRIERLSGFIITMIIFILLILPVVAMYKLTSVGERNSTFDAVGVLVVFTLLFSAAMSLLTKAQRHELFAASAAYCAVLVVFISNFSNDSNGGGGGRGA